VGKTKCAGYRIGAEVYVQEKARGLGGRMWCGARDV